MGRAYCLSPRQLASSPTTLKKREKGKKTSDRLPNLRYVIYDQYTRNGTVLFCPLDPPAYAFAGFALTVRGPE